jgi:hypothetical protein
MNDPFDLLRDQLVRVASPRRRRRHTGLAFLVATLALSGTAAAAAVTLTREDEPSAPLRGMLAPLARTPAEASPAATATPRAGVTPGSGATPGAGTSPGSEAMPGAGATPGSGTSPASGAMPGAGTPPGSGAMPGAGTPPGPGATPGAGGGSRPAVTAGARRYETPPVAPRPAVTPAATRYFVEVMPDLTAGQAGWCAGVTLRSGADGVGGRGCGPAARPGANLLAAGAMGVAFAVVGPRVARVDFGDGRKVIPRSDPGVPSGWRAAIAQAGEPDIALLDAAGRRLPTETHGSRLELRTEKVSPTRPPDAPCAITVRGLRPVSASLLTQFPKALKLAEPAFLSCATTVIYDGERRYRAAVLLDANHPGAPAPELPATPRFLTGRRVGNAWLAVFGGSSARERARVLDRLSVKRLP